MNKKCFVNINGGEDVIVVNIFDKSDKIITGHQCHHDTRQTRSDPDQTKTDKRCYGSYDGGGQSCNLEKLEETQPKLSLKQF